MTARESMTKDRTRSVNALNALMRSNDLSLDAREKLNPVQISEVSRWRHRENELSISIARAEAVRLARHVRELNEDLKAEEKQLDELVKASEAAPLLEVKGSSAISAARCLTDRVPARAHDGPDGATDIEARAGTFTPIDPR